MALNDPSQGLNLQMWTLSYDSVNVRVTAQSGETAVLFSEAQISELSLAFDQNMRPTVAYRVGGVLFLRWYDFTVPGYVTTNFGEGFSPRLSLDDKRLSQIASSDIIFAYIRAGTLYYRQQRDRYEVERALRSDLDPATRIKAIGMNRNWRMQFELV